MMGETVKVYMNLCMKIQVWLVSCKYRADVNVTLHIHTHTHTPQGVVSTSAVVFLKDAAVLHSTRISAMSDILRMYELFHSFNSQVCGCGCGYVCVYACVLSGECMLIHMFICVHERVFV
jgi:hypothetical protein